MANDRFLHGIRTTENNNGLARYIQTLTSNIIGLIGTAPDADATLFPLNKPVRVIGKGKAAKIGAAGTLKAALDGIFDQGGATVVVVRVEDVANKPNETLANIIGDRSLKTGLFAFKDSDEPRASVIS